MTRGTTSNARAQRCRPGRRARLARLVQRAAVQLGLTLVLALWLGSAAASAAAPSSRSPAAAVPAAAPARYVTVHSQAVHPRLSAYAQIEPLLDLRVRAPMAGILRDLRVLPGSQVRRGERLARIGGPRLRALRIARSQALRSAEARLRVAQRLLDIQRRQLRARLATQQALDAAQRELAAAQAAAATARARWHALAQLAAVRAPASGSVLALRAGSGERVARGATLLVLQPDSRLWIRAVYYGAGAARLRAGMRGRFVPATAGRPLGVRVLAVARALDADGGVPVELAATAARLPRWWMAGQWGEVRLALPAQRMVMVPTQALILDRGRWWVLLRDAGGDKRQRVVPGPARGWQTAIVSGLRAGQQVVVSNAMLEYHRGIARSYTPPD